MTTQEIAASVDPVFFAEKMLGFDLDAWQAEVLTNSSAPLVLNCSRQSGKSTMAAILALHRAIFNREALVLLIPPSLRQSSELLRKVSKLCRKLKQRPKIVQKDRISLTLSNGSRIISLPSNEDIIRGFSSVSLVIEDEAARVPDEVHQALLPMLAVSNGQYIQLSTPKGKKGHFYKACTSGDYRVFNIPARQVPRIPNQFLDRMKVELGTLLYSQEFLCQFIDQEGMSIHPEWIREYSSAAPQMASIIHSWDTAFKVGQEHDYSVCEVWGVNQNGYYLLDVYRARMAFPDLKKKAVNFYERDRPEVVLIEDHASGQSLIQELMRETSIPLKPIKVDRDKRARLNSVSPLFESGRIFLPKRASWKEDYLEELFSFPGEHDDQVDATTQALLYLKNRGTDENRSIADMHSEPCPTFTRQATMPDFGWRAPWKEDDDGFNEKDIIPYL